MKNSYIYTLILLFAFTAFINCAQKQVQVKQIKTEDRLQKVFEETDILTRFFKVCNSDIQEAVKVISNHKMSGMLTHLKKMDMEGRKYYLLEREHLTEMIRAVTEGTYSDLILINSKGVIIYTMTNDDIFGKHVKYHFKDTAFEKCFENSTNRFYINDISIFPPDKEQGSPKIFAAFPDRTNDYMKGVFIIQINIEIIEALFKKKITIVNRDGNCILDSDKENILKPYKYFYKIDLAKLSRTGKEQFEAEDKKYFYFPSITTAFPGLLFLKISYLNWR